MMLYEIFDSKLPLVWERVQGGEAAPFFWKDRQYAVMLSEPQLKVKELQPLKYAEASFFRTDLEGKKAFISNSENTEDVPARVLGVVLNALHSKFKEYDALYFTAEKQHSVADGNFDEDQYESKIRVFEFLADRIQKWESCWFYEAKDDSKHEFVVSKIQLRSTRFADRFKKLQETLMCTSITPGFR